MILQPKLEGASDEAAKSIQSLNDFCIESSLPVAKFYIVEYNSTLDETPEMNMCTMQKWDHLNALGRVNYGKQRQMLQKHLKLNSEH